jgi:hypothetical protein
MQTLFDAQTHQDIVRRIESLRPDSARQWGRMSPAQALEHASRALEMAIGRKPSRQRLVGKLIGRFFRKDFLGEKPFPKNSPTGPDFIIKDEPDFAATKARILALLAEFHALGERGCDGHVHGFFGRMTGAEWGKTQFKHVDHHLRQFGC